MECIRYKYIYNYERRITFCKDGSVGVREEAKLIPIVL